MSDEKTAKRRVTLRDVAQAAGVSLKTASNVINGSGRMTDETRTKVETVIKDLGYRVNVAARNLNRDHTGFITLAVPSLIPPYLAELANRTIEAARQRDPYTSPRMQRARPKERVTCSRTSTPPCQTA